jgi:hypothetical protein
LNQSGFKSHSALKGFSIIEPKANMDQFHFVNRMRLNANTRLAARPPQMWPALLRASQIVTPVLIAFTLIGTSLPGFGDERDKHQKKWAATWTTSPQDVFGGSSTPALVNFAFPNPTTDGANNQTLRMIVKPDLWGNTIRLRFSNTWGTQPVTLGRVSVGLQAYSGNILPGGRGSGSQHPGYWFLCAGSALEAERGVVDEPVRRRVQEFRSCRSSGARESGELGEEIFPGRCWSWIFG